MSYSRPETRQRDVLSRDAAAGETIGPLHCSSGSSLDAGHMSPLLHPKAVADAIRRGVGPIPPRRRTAAHSAPRPSNLLGRFS